MINLIRLFSIVSLAVWTTQLAAQQHEIDSLKTVIQKAQERQDKAGEAYATRYLAWIHADNGHPFEAMKTARRAIELYEALGKKSDVYKSSMVLLEVHQQMHNADKILEVALPIYQYAKQVRDTVLMSTALTAVGIGYDEKDEDQKALDCYLECIKLDEAQGESSALSYANASSSYTYLHNYTEGERFARIATAKSTEEGDTSTMVLAYLAHAFAAVSAGHTAAAEASIQQAEKWAATVSEEHYRRDLLQVKSMISATKSDYRQAYLQHIRYHELDSILSSEQRSAQFAELETIYETKKKETENAALNAHVQRQRFWILGILGAALSLGIIVWLQRKRLAINAQLLETEKALVETERRRAAEEKNFHQNSLDNFTQSLREKNSVIESLKTDLENRIAATPPSVKLAYSIEEKDNMVVQLTQATILTEEEWRNFRQKFERVYNGFFQKFTQTVPDATESEQRLAALTKLEMTNTEIASMLGISPDSVIKTRYRLRKKLGGEGLDTLLQTL